MRLLYLLSLLFISPIPLYAAIVLDHTLHSTTNTLVNNHIPETVGIRVGNNLFHSFEQFNLQQGEIATFSGNSEIQNIISRVTGGKASFIDGVIRSTIPDANFYLLNPAGLQFGANARLDIQGSFHATTADYVKLSDGGRFDATNPQDSLLTTAPVSAFGFLQAAAPIQIQGYGELNADNNVMTTGLSVPTGQTLSLIGGDINIERGSFFYTESINNRGKAITSTQRLPSLSAPSGRLNLIATASAGELHLNHTNLDLSSFSQLADIQIQDKSQLHVNGTSNGQVLIRAGQFILQDSQIQAHTNGNTNGSYIDIQADQIDLTQGSQISTQTSGHADGAKIHLQAQNVTISGQNADTVQLYPLLSKATSIGRGGDIHVQADSIEITDNDLESSADASGKGGDIRLEAQQDVKLKESIIYANAFSQETDAGDSGSVFIKADNIEISGGMINVGVFGSGQGGNIELRAKHNVDLIENVHLYSDAYVGRGNGGDTIVEAQNITLKDGAFIDTTAKNHLGDAGKIILKASGTVTISGVSQEGKGKASALKSGSLSLGKSTTGKGGLIQVEAGNLILTDGGLISSSSDAPAWGQSSDAGQIIIRVTGETKLSGANEFGENREGFGSGIYASTIGVDNNTGNSGSIDLQTGSLVIEKGAVIATNTNTQAQGGDITIVAQGDVHISGTAEGLVTKDAGNTQLRYVSEFSPKTHNQSTSGIYARTTGTDGESGQGGSITLSANQLILIDQGQISTSSIGDGQAGNISLNVNQLTMDSRSLIASDSHAANQYVYANEAERNEQMLVAGDVVKVLDSAGRIAYYAHNGSNLMRINYIHSVSDMQALQELTKTYLIRNGDVVRVEETGLRYMYEDLYGVFQVWTAFDESQGILEFDTKEALFTAVDGWYDGVKRPVPYPYGTVMRVKDAGDGKPATYVYSGLLDPFNNYYLAKPISLHRYEANNLSELQALPEKQSIANGALAILTAQQQTNYFIYNDGQWLDLHDNETHTVQNLAEQNELTVTHTGYIAELTDTGATQVYDGQQWVDLNARYRVNDLSQRNAIQANTGDIVTVESAENGQATQYIYSNNQWLTQIKGGNAGQLTLNVQDQIYLSGGSQITTESVSAGGGSIDIQALGSMFLNNAQISTSVQEGAGNGGNLTIAEPQFLTLNHTNAIAQAYKGYGGNILITAQEFIQSSDSLVSASSDLGIDGHVNISSPDRNIGNNLILLSKDFLKPIAIVDPCQQIRHPENMPKTDASFSLKANMYRHINDSLDNWQPQNTMQRFSSYSLSCE
ncbi:filamentous hemagglutinin N-terminal domain-containing protein [Candidatus Albibeggiatoa sp. nov. NOAA]|uniref:two-partner secretion domain-containing protein n=1 Tax=Candidatus Albibeggiatoa sp. nov. NOAA TaxID=3162724 RepID=UPI00330261A1|nr:filamentous hemagglutinin N-terminal domain-containing protein [Thiotrichaceae bacterium]